MSPRPALYALSLAVTAWLALFGDKTSASPEVVEATRPAASAAPRPLRAAVPIAAEPQILALLDRESLIGPDEGDGDEVFLPQSWIPPPPPPQQMAASAPVAPPVPFRYVGKQFSDGQWQVFLALGSSTLVAKEGDTLADNYQVKRITPPTLELVYLPLKQVQSLLIN